MMNEINEMLPDNVNNLIALLKSRAKDKSEYDDIICIVAITVLDDEDNINNDLIETLTSWIENNPSADIRRISDYLFSCMSYVDSRDSESA